MTAVAGAHYDNSAPLSERALARGIVESRAGAALAVLATAAGYYLGAWLASALRYPSSVHSVLWPPNAIVLAALLLLPPRLWWVALTAVLPAHILVLAPTGWPWPLIIGLFVTNTLQAVVGAVLTYRLARGSSSAASFMAAFVAGAVFIAPFLLSFADVGALFASGLADEYWTAWRDRFLSNAASIVIFVPPILAAAGAWRTRRAPPPKRILEAALLIGCFALLGAFVVFAISIAGWRSLTLCLFLPLLLWAAVRFEKGGASCALLGLVAVTMGSISRWGPAGEAQDDILMLQAFFLLVSIPVLYLAAMHSDLSRYVGALGTATERYRLAVAAGSVGVWELDLARGDLVLDANLKRMLGFEDAEIPNRVESWNPRIHPDDRQRVVDLTTALARGKMPAIEDEHRMLHRDGSIRWFLLRATAMAPAPGVPTRVLGTCIDVTERHRIGEELRKLELEAEQQRQELTHLTRVGTLGQLSGALAHELNQPLTAILSNAQAIQRLLTHTPLDLTELKVALSDIIEADKRAGDVISRLRILLKKGQREFRELDLNALIGETLTIAHSDLVLRGVTPTCRLAPDLPAVNGDRVQLQQMILNLVTNACEAMNDVKVGERLLTIATSRDEDRTIHLYVEDTGAGIAPEMQQRLFEPFVSTRAQGLGLGLAICRSIVTAHGGFIEAVNNPGRGSTFHVTLPAYSTGSD